MNQFKTKITNKLNGFREILNFSNRFELILLRTFFRSTRLRTYRLGRHEFICDHAHGDENSIRSAVATPMYLQFCRYLPRDHGLVVVDLGGNAGGFAAMLLSAGFLIERIVAVEMNPTTCSRLRFNLTTNCGESVSVLNAAVMGEDGQLQLALGAGSTSDSVFRESTDVGSRSTTVRGISLRTLWRDADVVAPVDVCKIDIEGAEYEALRGGRGQVLSNCRFIIIEVHTRPGAVFADVARELDQIGFDRVAEDGSASETEVVWLYKNRRAL